MKVTRIWYFNPENDLALAANKDNYTAPPAVVQLRRSGGTLPMWLGAPGDLFLCDGVNAVWLNEMQQNFGLGVMPWDHVSPGLPTPWGWSRSARAAFERAGIPGAALPPDSVLDEYRELSNRRTALEIHRRLAASLDFEVWPAGTEVTSTEQLDTLLYKQPASVVKLPWSSSGRGISFADSRSIDQVRKQAAGAIARYGSVIVERRARKVADFAMLLTVGGGCARFQGLSLFRADERGRYEGNFVGAQQAIAAQLGALYPIERLKAVATALEKAVYEVVGDNYAGPVGVDMLLAQDDDGTVILHPTVEVNLRYTMGFVALALARFTKDEAVFRVEKGDTTSTCRPAITDGKLTDGKLALNPPGGDFTFVLSVE